MKRGFIVLLLVLAWIITINIAVFNDYDAFLFTNVYPADPLYALNLSVTDYILKYIDIFFVFKNESQVFLIVLYSIMLFTTVSQSVLFISNKVEDGNIVDFNINLPPLLGVIGTIFSFTYFISYGDSSKEILTLFKENFNSAALTTIIGGITYMFNLFILAIDEYLNKYSSINKDT
ncbi:MAG: Unknown protein [uncultured Sulfurovum sp.]|uniref:Uncharacterized protein n=1 Tax=uncultured Sulfurovum sp. TaxID=269237 RepID=A0A6S6SDY8_9BACT|nr:MAG: Unknown protein [uncultured Sulfurovum sp.]